MQSTSSLITGCRWCSSDSEAVNMTRKECVKKETGRWLALMDRLLKQEAKLRSKEFEAKPCLKKREGTGEEQARSRRNFFREVLVKIAADVSAQTSSSNGIQSQSSDPLPSDLGTLAHEWFYLKATGMRLRMARRFVEWDGWEEGMAESMLGSEEFEEDWFKGVEYNADSAL
ncbi:hypothetical protein PQX77_019813 [Marasmius sp. AFHP31]|nr:hypothetical protein PQX77_019813 [Marasmius sp. AFHP31]